MRQHRTLLGLLAFLFVTCAVASSVVVLFAQSPQKQSAPASQLRRQIPKPTASCEGLASLTLPNAKVTLAKSTSDSSISPGPFCRVAATLTPSSDSDIKMELWMPMMNWNGKFQAVGNGAFNGAINYDAMAAASRRGYSAASTDTGHTGGGASWALGHPEKLTDFAWRSEHEMTVFSKTVIAAFYGEEPRYSYWNGCSAGGRQGMKEAERFPADFDGIIAGAPGLDWTGRAAGAVRVAQRLEAIEGARLLKPQRELLHKAVIEACDAIDGLKDGLIRDPRLCKFDPGVLQCKGSDTSACLTAPQVETARLIYSTAVNPKTKREITGLQPGSELGWTDLGWTESARATGLDEFRYLIFNDPSWTVAKFNFDADVVRAEEIDNDTVNALTPNLKPFFEHGGKLLQYHGWADPQISPGNSTQYYARVVEKLGGPVKVDASYRLFMVPGMAHCGGGEGPNIFDAVSVIEQWVEDGTAPDRMVASHQANGVVDRTRPLCPYPQVAAYKGAGSIDDAANFVCMNP